MPALGNVLSLGLLGVGLAVVGQLALLYKESLQYAEPPETPAPFTCAPLDKPAALDRFRGLIAFPSVSNISKEDHVNDQQVFRDMVSYLETAYPLVWKWLRVEQVGVNGLSLLITWPGSRPELRPVLFVSHYDVVPVTHGSEDSWTHPPFSGQLADGYVWGRGSADIKFSVAALLQAATGLLLQEDEGRGESRGAAGAPVPFTPERTIMFAFGHDEEIGGWHGAAATSALLRSRGVELDVVVDEGGVVLEDGIRPFTNRPVALVGTAEKGYVTLSVSLRSPGGHASMPPTDGSDVLSQLWRLSTALKLLPSPTRLQSPVTDMLTHLAPHSPPWLRLLLAGAKSRGPLNRLLGEVLRRLGGREAASWVAQTLALTRLAGGVADNVLPQEGVLGFNARLLPGGQPGEVVERLQTAARWARVEAEVKLKEDAAWPGSQVTSSEGRHFRLLRQAIQETWQLEGQSGPPAVVPYLVMGGTDSKHYAPLSYGGVLRFVPYAMNKSAGDVSRVHATDERIRADSFPRAVCTYARLMQLMAGPGQAEA